MTEEERQKTREALGIQFAFAVCACGHPAHHHFEYKDWCADHFCPCETFKTSEPKDL